MTRRRYKTKEPKASRIARSVGVPDAQARRGDLVLVDAPNLNATVHRGEAVAPKHKVLTVKRTTRIQQLVNRKALTPAEGKVCEWYLERHMAGYETNCTTANYGGSGAQAGWRVFSLSPRYLDQEVARRELDAARVSIDGRIVGIFERVVLHDRPIGRLAIIFRLAVRQLADHLEQMGIAA